MGQRGRYFGGIHRLMIGCRNACGLYFFVGEDHHQDLYLLNDAHIPHQHVQDIEQIRGNNNGEAGGCNGKRNSHNERKYPGVLSVYE